MFRILRTIERTTNPWIFPKIWNAPFKPVRLTFLWILLVLTDPLCTYFLTFVLQLHSTGRDIVYEFHMVLFRFTRLMIRCAFSMKMDPFIDIAPYNPVRPFGPKITALYFLSSATLPTAGETEPGTPAVVLATASVLATHQRAVLVWVSTCHSHSTLSCVAEPTLQGFSPMTWLTPALTHPVRPSSECKCPESLNLDQGKQRCLDRRQQQMIKVS